MYMNGYKYKSNQTHNPQQQVANLLSHNLCTLFRWYRTCQHNSTYCSAPDIKIPYCHTESLLDYKRRVKGQSVFEAVIYLSYPGVKRREVLFMYICMSVHTAWHRTRLDSSSNYEFSGFKIRIASLIGGYVMYTSEGFPKFRVVVASSALCLSTHWS